MAKMQTLIVGPGRRRSPCLFQSELITFGLEDIAILDYFWDCRSFNQFYVGLNYE
jgi:hypothetical protein